MKGTKDIYNKPLYEIAYCLRKAGKIKGSNSRVKTNFIVEAITETKLFF
jgi:hypothetical protein